MFFKVVALIFFAYGVVFVQVSHTDERVDTSSIRLNTGDDNRVRIFTGLVGNWDVQLSKISSYYPFINAHYRSSGFSKSDSSSKSKLGFSVEVGTNYIIIPYFKIGPEFRHAEGLFVDAHAGITTFFTSNAVVPFYGVEFGIIGNPTDKTRIELEVGVNAGFAILPYFAVGVSF